MTTAEKRRSSALRVEREAKWGYALALLLGVPLPILVVVYLLRG
jgi:hypothetical protein